MDWSAARHEAEPAGKRGGQNDEATGRNGKTLNVQRSTKAGAQLKTWGFGRGVAPPRAGLLRVQLRDL